MSLTKEIIAYVDSTIKRYITTSMTRVVQEAHTHPNKPLLDTLTSAGAGTLYLADDGTYRPAGGGGGGVERRNDWQSPYSYCGSAPTGSSESANVWDIYRIEVFTDGTVNVMSAIGVAWTNRYTVIYT
jgi:hypothetical protein